MPGLGLALLNLLDTNSELNPYLSLKIKDSEHTVRKRTQGVESNNFGNTNEKSSTLLTRRRLVQTGIIAYCDGSTCLDESGQLVQYAGYQIRIEEIAPVRTWKQG